MVVPLAIPHPHTQPVVRDASALQPSQAGAQMAIYWRMKVMRALDAFESEARRMLGLETQLEGFADQYQAVLGAALLKLSTMEVAFDAGIDGAVLATHQQQCRARKDELKTRYRSMAMDVHPDRAQQAGSVLDTAPMMQQLTTAYRAGDLAGLLKLEAQLHLMKIAGADYANSTALEAALRDVARAGDTYAQGYREMLNSPLNKLMLKTIVAQREGWDWMQATLRKLEQTLAEQEQVLSALVSVSGIGQERALIVAA